MLGQRLVHVADRDGAVSSRWDRRRTEHLSLWWDGEQPPVPAAGQGPQVGKNSEGGSSVALTVCHRLHTMGPPTQEGQDGPNPWGQARVECGTWGGRQWDEVEGTRDWGILMDEIWGGSCLPSTILPTPGASEKQNPHNFPNLYCK